MRLLFVLFLVLFSKVSDAVESNYSGKSGINKSVYRILQPYSVKDKNFDSDENVNAIITTKNLVGRVEKIRLYPGNIKLKARIDTGAGTSSLHVTSTELFFLNDEAWIRFTVTALEGRTVQFERKIQRISTIKRHYDEEQNRIVVLMGICLGKTYREAEVNLFDREGLNYPILIGRNFLSGYYIVDSSQIFSVEPNCKKLSENE